MNRKDYTVVASALAAALKECSEQGTNDAAAHVAIGKTREWLGCHFPNYDDQKFVTYINAAYSGANV